MRFVFRGIVSLICVGDVGAVRIRAHVGGEDALLQETQTWISTEYSNAANSYKTEGVISTNVFDEVSVMATSVLETCRAYLDNAKSLIQDGEGGAERMLKQYLSEVKNDLHKTGWKQKMFHAGHSLMPNKVISRSEYVEKKLKKILLKLQTLLDALASQTDEMLDRGMAEGQQWTDGQSPIEIVSPLQYPFRGGPTEYLQSAYGRVSVLKTIEAWPIIPRRGLHLVYHGTGNLPRQTAGEYLTCGTYDSLADQGHGLFVDADPMHAPLDFLAGSQFGVGERFRAEEVGYIWEIEAVDFRGRPARSNFPRQCRPDPVEPTGIGTTANAFGWMRLTMRMKENTKRANYYDERGLCKCNLRINNVFAVNRWMRNVIIDYHKGTNACKQNHRCPKNMVGTWD